MISQAQFRLITKQKPKSNDKITSTLYRYLTLLFIAIWTVTCQAEYFSSTDSIPVLAIAEDDLIQWYKNFLQSQAKDFAVYRNFIKRVKDEHALALEDPEAYLGNPINAYKFIKRTVIDWGIITENVRNNTSLQALKANLTSLTTEMPFPDISELHGAAKGLGRLQTMYNLSTTDLADGFINDIYYGSELTVHECFEIGCNLFEVKEYPLAKEWLNLVLNLIYIGENSSIINSENDFQYEVNTEENRIQKEIGGIENTTFSNQQTKAETKRSEAEDENEYEDEYKDEYEENEDNSDDGYNENDNENDAEDGDKSEMEDNLDNIYDPVYETRYGEYAPLYLYELDEEGNIVNESDIGSSDKKVSSSGFSSENYTVNYINEKKPSAFKEDPATENILIETLEYLALASYELGQKDEMRVYFNELLKINPEYVFKDLLVYMDTKEPQNLTDFDSLSDLQRHEWFANYSRLCQGKQVEQKELHQLKCKLDTLNHPLFILSPLRKEELHADPEIVVYHGLLSDKHIDNILDQSEAYMARSRVGGGNVNLVRDVRVSQQTWLTYHSPTLKYIYRTVSAISGFDLTNAEDMQVANYGIGGQYDPHHDYFDNFDPTVKSPWIGDRIATHLFFASDVEQGGYTVFPLLNVYAKPVKGSMVMWRNLHKSLDPDRRTLHAGCPVIKGTKRICNVWVHSGYQEFSHPCDLVRDNYKSAHV